MSVVSKERCPHCGRSMPLWTPATVREALLQFNAEHGRAPKVVEWRSGHYGYPNYDSVLRCYGTWRKALKAAGLKPPPRDKRWTRKSVGQAVFEFVYEHGRPPMQKEWIVGTDRNPTQWMVRQLFGSWNEMLEELGYPLARRTRREAA